MSSNKAKIGNMQTEGGAGLVKALLKILAFGIAGGAALLGGAKAVGDKLEENNADEKFK